MSEGLALWFSDLLLDQGKFGLIRWRPENGKTGKGGVTRINAELRATIDQILPERPELEKRMPSLPLTTRQNQSRAKSLENDYSRGRRLPVLPNKMVRFFTLIGEAGLQHATIGR